MNRSSQAAAASAATVEGLAFRAPGSRGRLLLLIDRLVAGGAEQVLLAYAPRLVAAGFAVRVVLLVARPGNPIADLLERQGIAVEALPFERLLDPIAGYRLWRHVRQLRPDLIHTQLEWANVWGTLVAQRLRVPSLATLHTLDAPAPGTRARRRARLTNWLLDRAPARIVCVSDEVQRHYCAMACPPPAKLLTLYNGVDLEGFTRASGVPAETRRRLGVPPRAVLLTTVAVLRPDKGIRVMLSALAELRRRGFDVFYLVVGDGSERAALEAYADALGVAGRVGFAGHRTDVPALLAASDLFVLPTFKDALPTVVAEAMACALPVVASRVGGVPEMVDDGHTGLLVPPDDVAALADACARLIQDRGDRARLGRAGRILAAERFALDRQVAKLGQLYDDVIAGAAG